MLVENNEIVREEKIIANIMNNYFTNITTQLKIKPNNIGPQIEFRKYNRYLRKL